jgi:hypothetical protein
MNWLCDNFAEILSILGMLITLVGAAKTAISVRLTPYEAGQTAASRIMSDDEHEWQNMPLAQSLIKASHGAMWGLIFIALGTLFQITSALMTI